MFKCFYFFLSAARIETLRHKSSSSSSIVAAVTANISAALLPFLFLSNFPVYVPMCVHAVFTIFVYSKRANEQTTQVTTSARH